MPKAVRNGKLYDTDTAELLGTYTSPYLPNDGFYYKESLYRKKNGEFFVSGEGGSLTKYAQCFVNGRGYGYSIFLLSEDVAKHWVEQYLDADDYIDIFGEVQE